MIVSGGNILAIHKVEHDVTFSGDGVKVPLGLDQGLYEEIQKTSAKLDKSAFESWSAQTQHWDIEEYKGGDGIKVDGHEISVSGDYAKKSDIPGLVDYVGGYGIEVRKDTVEGKTNVNFIFSGASSQYPVSGDGTAESPFGIWKEAVDRWNDVSSKFDASGMSAYAQSAWVEQHYLDKDALDDYYTKDEVYAKTETSGKQELADEFAKYQLSGDYMPADALDDLSGKWDGAYDTLHEHSAAWNEVSSFHNTRVHSTNGSIGVNSGYDENGNRVFDLSVETINIPDIYGYDGVEAHFDEKEGAYAVGLSGDVKVDVDITSSGKTIDITSSAAGHFNLEISKESCQHWLGGYGPTYSHFPGDNIGHTLGISTGRLQGSGAVDYVGNFIDHIEKCPYPDGVYDGYIYLKPGLYYIDCIIRYQQDREDLSNTLDEVLVYTGYGNANESIAYQLDSSGPEANGNRHNLRVTFVRHVTESDGKVLYFAPSTKVQWTDCYIQKLQIVKLDSCVGGGSSGGLEHVATDDTIEGDGTVGNPLSIQSTYEDILDMIDTKAEDFDIGPGLALTPGTDREVLDLNLGAGLKTDPTTSALHVGVNSGIKFDQNGNLMANINSGLSFNSAGQMCVDVGYGLTYSGKQIILDAEVEGVVDTVNRLKRELDGKLTTNFPYPLITNTHQDFTDYLQSMNGDCCICQLFSVSLNHMITEDTYFTVYMMDTGYPNTKVMLGIFEYDFEGNNGSGTTNWVCDTGPISLGKQSASDRLDFRVTHINPEHNELRSDRAYYAVIAIPAVHNTGLFLACANGYDNDVHANPTLNWRWQNVGGISNWNSPDCSLGNSDWWNSEYAEYAPMKRFFLQIRNHVGT